ncbi:MAG: hypothetical protein ABH840_01255 [Nanoarchaeota archaeon]
MEIYAINGRISFEGWAEYWRDETIEQMRDSIKNEIKELYRRKPQEFKDPVKCLVMFYVSGEEVGRVQHDLYGISYRVMHPRMGVDDFLADNKRFIEKNRKFRDTISA